MRLVEVIDCWREGRPDTSVQEEKLAVPAIRSIAASTEPVLSEHVLSKQVLSFKCVQVSVLEKCQESQESCRKLRSWQPLVREDGP